MGADLTIRVYGAIYGIKMATKNVSHVYLLFWWLKSKHCKSGKFLVLDFKNFNISHHNWVCH